MASNPTPDNNSILRALADRLADGCDQHEGALGIVQNTEARIRIDIGALDGAELQVGLKKAAVSDAYDALQTADAAGVTCIGNCKLRLQQKLGQKWSAAWEPTGFPTGSLAVPDSQDERFTLINDLKLYFMAVPANESAEMEATAAACLAAWTALSDARQGVATAESAQTTAMNNRSTAEHALRMRVRGLINELEQLLGEDDPRWEDFGLNIPGNPSAPEPVETVTLEAMTNHRIGVGWTYATRAIRYRVETMIVGVDTEWQNKGSFKDLETTLKNFSAGQVVKVRVIAGNDGGDAAPSPEGEVTVT
ncbi:MAG: fibronectin type III domain-containing protein [Chthoniobacteraceae bacterium]